MAKKKEQSIDNADWLDGQAAPVPAGDGKMVRVLSSRIGDLVMPRGVLRHMEIMEMPQDEADALMAQWPGLLRII